MRTPLQAMSGRRRFVLMLPALALLLGACASFPEQEARPARRIGEAVTLPAPTPAEPKLSAEELLAMAKRGAKKRGDHCALRSVGGTHRSDADAGRRLACARPAAVCPRSHPHGARTGAAQRVCAKTRRPRSEVQRRSAARTARPALPRSLLGAAGRVGRLSAARRRLLGLVGRHCTLRCPPVGPLRVKCLASRCPCGSALRRG